MVRTWMALVLALACAGACSGPDPKAAGAADAAGAAAASLDGDTGGGDVSAPTIPFPKGFLWGAAIAGFQVDMGCPTLPAAQCEDTHSDWYQWVTDPQLIKDESTWLSGEPPSAGPGFWELWPKYLDGAHKDLHLGALRTSIEWSRLFPSGDAEKATTVSELAAYADKTAVATYHAIFAGAKARGLKLFVTLNHYSLPLWIHDGKACHADLDKCKNRGWVDKDRMLKAIALYSGFCAKEFGADVDLWGTINEPFAIVIPGYLLPSKERSNPPGVPLQADTAIAVAFALMEGHARMYDAVHANDGVDNDGDGKKARVGIVANLAAVAPFDPNDPSHVAVAPHADYVYNKLFLNAVIHGEVDYDLDGVIGAKEKRDDMKGKMDFIGVNYYTRLRVKPQVPQLFPQYKLFDFLPDSNLFSNYPEGIKEVVMLAHSYKLPIFITENGTGDAKGGAWQGFVRPHLAELKKAIDAGAVVEGYFYWTLMDNYEWNHGVKEIRMGLYDVDNATKAFSLSPLGKAYGEAVLRNGL